jgi:DNA-binding CsgD family transcriptional regulator
VVGGARTWPLVGRGDELDLLDEQVLDGHGSTVVAGPAGVGKSRLVSGWLLGLGARGCTTVAVRATRSTATVPFGAFASWVPERWVDTAERLGILRATVARLVGLGSQRLVVAVDDAQVLDEGSAALVLHLAEHTSVSVVATVRSGEPCPDGIVALWKEGIASRIDLAPLSEAVIGELLNAALGGGVLPATVRRLWELTRGNPMYLREVVEAALAQGVLAPGGGEWRWEGNLAGHTRLHELVSDRLGDSGTAERRVLETIALGEPLPIAVAAALAPRRVLAALEDRELVTVDRTAADGPGPTVGLGHPLYAEVLRAELLPFTAQGRLADLAGAALATGLGERDPVRVASWLIDSGEPPDDPELFMRAAFTTRMVHDYELSARFAEAAARAGGGWRATLARAEALSGLRRWADADQLLSELAAPGCDPLVYAAVARARADQAFWRKGADVTRARAMLARAADLVGPPASASLLAGEARLALVALEVDESIRLATEAVAVAGTVVDRLHGVTCAALAAALRGDTGVALDIVDMVAAEARAILAEDPTPAGYAAFTYSFALPQAGRIGAAVRFFQSVLEWEQVQGGGPAQALPAFWLARAMVAQGRLTTAVRLCTGALDSLGGENHFGRGTWVANTLASAAAQAGDSETAAAALAWVDERTLPEATTDGVFTDLARVWLLAARGEMSNARTLALDAARRAGGAGASTVEMLILVDLARLDAPAAATERLGELVAAVEGPFSPAAADFARAAAKGAAGDLDDVARRFAAMGAFLMAAEAAAAAADAHGAGGQRRDQAASTAAAQRFLARCEGAATPLLARLDRDSLVAALTDREREVAGLAARGRSSRQIADALVISVRTVDSHLNHAYTKLGISDRADLAAALGQGAGERDR